MNLHQLISSIKEEKIYWSSVLLVCVLIILFFLNVPYREIIILGGLLIFSGVLLLKILK